MAALLMGFWGAQQWVNYFLIKCERAAIYLCRLHVFYCYSCSFGVTLNRLSLSPSATNSCFARLLSFIGIVEALGVCV